MRPVLDPPSTTPAIPDRELLERATAGDRDAFRVVYERHVGAIRGYLSGRVGPDAAEDVTSETFIEAWSARSRFDAKMTSARPWLYGIATNVMARHREREDRWLAGVDAALPGTDSVEHAPVAFELDTELARAIRLLSPQLRDVLLLTALAEMQVTEAAKALGISSVSARVRLHRARTILTNALAKEHLHD